MMKSSRLILIGVFLLLAGVVGFLTSLTNARQANNEEVPRTSVDEVGFLPMSLPIDRQRGAPTLQPQATATNALPGKPSPTQRTTTHPEIAPDDTATPDAPLVPDRIVIPKIELDAPVVTAKEEKVKIGSEEFLQYLAPDKFAAGWHPESAPLGAVGNTVLNGHHNVHGKVFGRLVDLVPGDRILVYSGDTVVTFQVANVLILPERDADLATRLENARWIEHSNDIRLTLVTCWPEYSNTHRLIIVASVVSENLNPIE